MDVSGRAGGWVLKWDSEHLALEAYHAVGLSTLDRAEFGAHPRDFAPKLVAELIAHTAYLAPKLIAHAVYLTPKLIAHAGYLNSEFVAHTAHLTP